MYEMKPTFLLCHKNISKNNIVFKNKYVILHRFSAKYYFMGLTGFDGKMRWYVSMRRLVGYLLNLSEQKLIGERNYALAA